MPHVKSAIPWPNGKAYHVDEPPPARPLRAPHQNHIHSQVGPTSRPHNMRTARTAHRGAESCGGNNDIAL
jgi:hypothetical protein